jgi:hypothetical protein
MFKKILISLITAFLLIPGVFAQAEGLLTLTAADLTPLILAISIIGMVSAVFIIISIAGMPSGDISVGGSFKSFLIIGAILISVAEIILATEAFGLLSVLPLPLVHDTTMAVSIVFIALALREAAKKKIRTVSE